MMGTEVLSRGVSYGTYAPFFPLSVRWGRRTHCAVFPADGRKIADQVSCMIPHAVLAHRAHELGHVGIVTKGHDTRIGEIINKQPRWPEDITFRQPRVV